MPTRISEAAWVRHEAERARGVLVLALRPGGALPDGKLRQLLQENGLEYGPAEFQQIKAQLIREGFLEED